MYVGKLGLVASLVGLAPAMCELVIDDSDPNASGSSDSGGQDEIAASESGGLESTESTESTGTESTGTESTSDDSTESTSDDSTSTEETTVDCEEAPWQPDFSSHLIPEVVTLVDTPGLGLRLEIRASTETGQLEVRLCKVNDMDMLQFMYPVHLTFADTLGLITFDEVIEPTGTPCSSYKPIVGDLLYAPGELMQIAWWRVVSPSSVSYDWNGACDDDPMPNGFCWYAPTGPALTRSGC